MNQEIKAKWRQYGAAVVVNLASFCVGTALGWISPVQPFLESADSPVGPLSREQISWMGSLNFMGGVIGTFFWGRVSGALGRKRTGLILALPFALGWATILLASNEYWMYFGRIIIGSACSGNVINTPIYVTEVAEDSNRGTLGSLMMFGVNLGYLFSYSVGAVTSYYVLTSICFAIPLIYFVCLLYLPESPVYLLMKNRKEEAETALLWYRGDDPVKTEKELTNLTSRPSKARSTRYKDLVASRGPIRGMLIGFGLLVGQQLCGMMAILTYTVTIFTEVGSSLTPHQSAITVGLLQCMAAFVSSILVDKAGRKVLLVVSYTGMSMSLLTLSAFYYFRSDIPLTFGFIPVLSLSLHVITYSLGSGPIPFIVTAEFFSADMRSIALPLLQLSNIAMSFASVKLFPWFNDVLGNDGCFLFFALCCIASIVFSVACVPETKGKTIDSILRRLNGDVEAANELLTPSSKALIIKPMNATQKF